MGNQIPLGSLVFTGGCDPRPDLGLLRCKALSGSGEPATRQTPVCPGARSPAARHPFGGQRAARRASWVHLRVGTGAPCGSCGMGGLEAGGVVLARCGRGCVGESDGAPSGFAVHSMSAVGRNAGEDGLSSEGLAQTAASGRPAHLGNGMGRQAVLRVLRREVRLAAHGPGLVGCAGGPLRWRASRQRKTRSKPGKPRRASGGVVRQRTTATTDSPMDGSLEVGRPRAVTAGGHARAVTLRQLSVEGNALKGLAPWEWKRSAAGMRARVQQPGEPHGRQGDATSSRCLRWRNPSRWCETTWMAHVWRLAASGRSRRWSAGGRAEGEHGRGADTTTLGARRVATSAV